MDGAGMRVNGLVDFGRKKNFWSVS